jgi:hypothetical protein
MKRRSLLKTAAACVPAGLFNEGAAHAQPWNDPSHQYRLYCLSYPNHMLWQTRDDVYLGIDDESWMRTYRDDNYLWRVALGYEDGLLQGVSFSVGYDFLQGRPLNGTVGLGRLHDIGTYWQVTDAGGGAFFIRCSSRVEGPHWLEGRPSNGRTVENTVGLARNMTQPSAKWQMVRSQNGTERLEEYFGTRPHR